MSAFLTHFLLAAPLFILVLAGYLVVRLGHWPASASDALTRFVFSLALPALLFRLMSGLSQLPPVDSRLLLAFFGGCFIVFAIGRLLARAIFRLDGVSQSVFALGGIFSNNVLLGVPYAKSVLGEAALPAVALVLVFNALTLWTLATVSVEWARYGELSLKGFVATARSVLTNPLVAAILTGAGFGLLGLRLPALVDQPLSMLADAAAPMALVVLGMGLAQYGVRAAWPQSLAICALKLILMPMVVLALAWLLHLPPMETRVVVLLAALSVGVNVYLMAREFDSMQAAIASSMVLSTALSSLTAPLALALAG
jgi:malonate transporter and related proteins